VGRFHYFRSLCSGRETRAKGKTVSVGKKGIKKKKRRGKVGRHAPRHMRHKVREREKREGGGKPSGHRKPWCGQGESETREQRTTVISFYTGHGGSSFPPLMASKPWKPELERKRRGKGKGTTLAHAFPAKEPTGQVKAVKRKKKGEEEGKTIPL